MLDFDGKFSTLKINRQMPKQKEGAWRWKGNNNGKKGKKTAG